MQSLDKIDGPLNESLNLFLSDAKKRVEKNYLVEEANEEEVKRVCSILDASQILPDYDRATFINCYKIQKQKSTLTAYLIKVLIDYRLRPSKFHSGDFRE